MNEQLFTAAAQYVDKLFAGDASGHDAAHTMRVYKTAMRLAETEECDRAVVALAALLHDADDRKLFHTTAYANAVTFLREQKVDESTIARVCHAIGQVSFKGRDSVTPDTIEGMIVQDADRLDAIGAVGIARAFAYGGSHGRAMYAPDEKPKENMSDAEYSANAGTTINHFYEKLLLLKDMMNTASGRAAAEGRHQYMMNFLDEFYAEWNGEK